MYFGWMRTWKSLESNVVRTVLSSMDGGVDSTSKSRKPALCISLYIYWEEMEHIGSAPSAITSVQ
uniref:Uncharacterized protein n=1 Tax=Arion vulgaris TaxID=1028688 RepID=A0A0B6ZC63_9EUPU